MANYDHVQPNIQYTDIFNDYKIVINDLPSVCLLKVCVFWERWQEQVCQNAVKTMSYLAMFSNQISSLHQTISYLSFGPQLFEVFVCYHVIYNGNWSRCCSRHFDLSYGKLLPSNHKCNNRANRPLTEKSLGSLSETRSSRSPFHHSFSP